MSSILIKIIISYILENHTIATVLYKHHPLYKSFICIYFWNVKVRYRHT